MTGVMALSAGALTACSGSNGTEGSADEQVIIYSNADDEAVEAMKNALDGNGFEGQYMFQTFGTSELGGKLIAEGANPGGDAGLLPPDHVSGGSRHYEHGSDGRSRPSHANLSEGPGRSGV